MLVLSMTHKSNRQVAQTFLSVRTQHRQECLCHWILEEIADDSDLCVIDRPIDVPRRKDVSQHRGCDTSFLNEEFLWDRDTFFEEQSSGAPATRTVVDRRIPGYSIRTDDGPIATLVSIANG